MKLPDSYKDAWKASQERIRELELNMKTERKLHKLEIDELRELLKRLEWTWEEVRGGMILICPSCKMAKSKGHAADCELAEAIDEV